MLKNISVSCQTTDGLLNSGQLEYHIFITAINIPAHHRHLYHHMCTLQISAVQRPQAPSPLAPMLHCFAEAVATAQRSSGGGCTPHHWRLLRSAAVAGTAAQRSSGGRRVVAQHATSFSMLPQFAAQRFGDLKKCVGRAGPGEGQEGMGGPGREGEGQLLNSIVVEALAGVCESEPKIECNSEFRTPLIKSIEISYTISYATSYTI